MQVRSVIKKASIWSKLSVCSLGCGLYTFFRGIDKMVRYYNSESVPSLNKNAYVGGDAYNYIINGNYATAFFVLTTMFVLASIGLMVLHYVSKDKISPSLVESQKKVIEDIEANLPQI